MHRGVAKLRKMHGVVRAKPLTQLGMAVVSLGSQEAQERFLDDLEEDASVELAVPDTWVALAELSRGRRFVWLRGCRRVDGVSNGVVLRCCGPATRRNFHFVATRPKSSILPQAVEPVDSAAQSSETTPPHGFREGRGPNMGQRCDIQMFGLCLPIFGRAKTMLDVWAVPKWANRRTRRRCLVQHIGRTGGSRLLARVTEDRSCRMGLNKDGGHLFASGGYVVDQ